MLCEASAGYIWNSVLYTGKGTKFDEKYSQYSMATLSIMSLVDPLLNQGYCVTTDNFYMSPELYDLLLEKKTDCHGTVRPNRRNMPEGFGQEKLECGAVAARQRGKVMAIRWKDNKDVSLLSTIHNASTETVLVKGNKLVTKPKAVLEYNHTMAEMKRQGG
jgi:hypothetical protein